jgi:hypothetical protein
MNRVPKALAVLCAAAVLPACSHADRHHAVDEVVLIQRGSRVTNAYALAYQTCATTLPHSRGPRSLRRCVPQLPEGVLTLSRGRAPHPPN